MISLLDNLPSTSIKKELKKHHHCNIEKLTIFYLMDIYPFHLKLRYTAISSDLARWGFQRGESRFSPLVTEREFTSRRSSKQDIPLAINQISHLHWRAVYN